LLLDGNVGLGGVSLVVLELAQFGGGVCLVAGEETVTAEGPCSTVTEKPVMPDKLDVVTSVTGFDAVHTNGITL